MGAGILNRTHLSISALSRRNTTLSPSSSLILYRHRSNKSGTSKFSAHLLEVDLDPTSSPSATSSSSSSPGGDVATGVRKLEDVIYNIIVRRSAPDWLPFLPGSSYWVPPRRRCSSPLGGGGGGGGGASHGLVNIIGNLAVAASSSSTGRVIMSTGDDDDDGESLSMSSSVRGWPSSSYFLHGSSPVRPVPVDVQVVEVKFQDESENESQSEDDSDH